MSRSPVVEDAELEYDEDAAVCRCGHTFRDHTGKALGYACMMSIGFTSVMCDCRSFRAAMRAPNG